MNLLFRGLYKFIEAGEEDKRILEEEKREKERKLAEEERRKQQIKLMPTFE